MKIFLAQQNYHIGNFKFNTGKIIEGIEKAKAQGADLVLFPELSVCGYPPRDFLNFKDFIDQCYAAIDEIKVHADTIGVLIGSPARNPQVEGKDLFNAAFFLHEGEVKAEVHKTLLPNYDILTSTVILNRLITGTVLNLWVKNWPLPFAKTSGTWVIILYTAYALWMH